MLELDDFIPIDVEKLKARRDAIYNIPNDGFLSIEKDVFVINSSDYPMTLRLYLLNHLPYCVIEILKEK